MWFDQCQLLAIKKLPRIPDDKKVKKAARYLVLSHKESPILTRDETTDFKILTLQQARQQNITDDTILLLMMTCAVQNRIDDNGIKRNDHATGRLLLTPAKVPTGKYLVAVEVMIKDHILMLVSRTFVESDRRSGYMVSNGCLKWGETSRLFIDRGIQGKKSLTDFFSLQTLDKLDHTKLGLYRKLLDQFNHNDYRDCFTILPTFRFSEVDSFSDKTKLMAIKRLMECYQGKQLNVFCDIKQEKVTALFNQITDRMQQSAKIKVMGLTITTDKQACRGLNLQVLLDQHDPQYLCSEETKIIQHLTFETFGKFDEMTKTYQWQLSAGDIMDDPKFQMTLYQLLIKHDILNQQLTVPSRQELKQVAQFQFLTFEHLNRQKNENSQIRITRMKINDTGDMFFDSLVHEEGKRTKKSDLSQIYERILQYSGQNMSQLDGVLIFKEHLFAIYQTSLITVPAINDIRQHMQQASDENTVERQVLLEVAQSLKFTGRHYTEQQKQLIRNLTAINKTTITMRELRQQLILSWRLKVMNEFNQHFYKATRQWLHLPIRQKQYDSYWMGTYGMGLVELMGQQYYFVGRTQEIELKQVRAIPMRKIVAIDSDNPKKDTMELFDILKQLMQVGFVRLNQYTVKPFAFKYISEYLDLKRHQKNDV